MPTPKKPADKLQRRNKPKEIAAQVVDINSKSPPAPKGISRELQAEWRALWKQEIASTYRDEHLAPLKRLFKLRHQEAILDEEGFESPMVAGSTGQAQINPLLKHAKELRAEIKQLEDSFGLNPLAYSKLGLAFGEAHKSLDDMNKRITNAASGGGANERPDPRLSNVIDVTSR